MMDQSSYDALSARLRGVLISLGNALSEGEVAEVVHFVDHDEFGEALRALVGILVDEGKEVKEAELVEIRKVAADMGILEDVREDLDELFN
jgi:hypothetical protein